MSAQSNTIPNALENFDRLPDSAQVRQPVVEALFGVSAATVWRRVRDQRIPTPRKLSPRCTTWNVGELRRALRGVAA
jgi:predicted DNA-binding transcriptional regulator AlpA